MTYHVLYEWRCDRCNAVTEPQYANTGMPCCWDYVPRTGEDLCEECAPEEPRAANHGLPCHCCGRDRGQP